MKKQVENLFSKNCNEEKYSINQSDVEKVKNILKEECNFLEILEKNKIKIKFIICKNEEENIKYDEEHKEYSVYLLNNDKNYERCKEERILKQFGLVLHDFLEKNHQEYLEEAIEIYRNFLTEIVKQENTKEMFNTNQFVYDSNEFADVFAEIFVHYIIEKEDRKQYSKIQLAELEQMNLKEEKAVRRILQYFDNLFQKLEK